MEFVSKKKKKEEENRRNKDILEGLFISTL